MSRKLGVVVAVLLAGGLLASCGLVEHKSSSSAQQPIAPSSRTQPTVQPTTTAVLPKPVKTTAAGPSDNQILTKNKLYSVGAMKSIGCHEPKVKPTSASAVQAYYHALLRQCLDRAWPATIKAAGYVFRAPSGNVWSNTVDTPCGPGSGIVSFYCPSDETIYPSGDEILFVNRTYGTVAARHWATHVLPHEYGHHVQQMTGIMTAYQHLYDEASSQAAKDQLTRRLELQASCLGHVFLIANKSSYPITSQMLNDWSWRTIKIPNHGSVASQRYWISRAVALKRPGACNTFAAPAAKVT